MKNRLLKALLRLIGKDQGKVIAVFAVSNTDAQHMVRYLRDGAPGVPVWLFALESIDEKTSALCERVVVRESSIFLLLSAQRLLWPHQVALIATRWNAKPGQWAIEGAPILIPPFRALIFNEHDDSFAGPPGAVFARLLKTMIQQIFDALLRFFGKGQDKVLAVFAISAADAHASVRYLRDGAPGVPVWLFSLEPPTHETAVLCDEVHVRKSAIRLFLTGQKRLWPRRVALSAARWDGQAGHWSVKTAPLLIPFFRALIFNEHNDSFSATPAAVFRHVRHRWFSGDARPPAIFTFGLRLLLSISRRLGRPPLARLKLETLHAKWTGRRDRLKPYDVLVFPVIDWDWRFQRPQQLSLELARRGHRVFYLSTQFLPAFGLSEPRTREVAKNIWVVDLPASLDPPDIYRDIPNVLQLAALELGLQCLKDKFHIGATLSLVDYPFWAPLVRRLSDNIVVYDCMDDYLSFSNAGRPARELEPEIVADANLVVCASTYLQERVWQLGRDSFLIRNAADPEHFGPRPASLAIEPGPPTIGYHGSITESTDVDLLSYAARSLPDFRFVIIGRNDRGDLSGLDRWPNVTLVGEVPYDRLPEYVHVFDVGLLPYLIDDHSIATDPVKIWEYLCAGKPVVAVRFPEIERLGDLIALTDNPDQFIDAIRSALADDSPAATERRRAFARENTWSNRCDAIEQAVAPFFPKVSIVVLAYNNRDFTERTISTIEEFTAYPNLEVVLVDNASTDGTPELLMQWAAAHEYAKVILNPTNLGFSAGNNIGVRAATGDYLVILNNDVCLTDGWLPAMLAHFRASPSLGILGAVTNTCGNEGVVYIGDYDDVDKMAILARAYTGAHRGQRTELRTANFFCVMIPRAVWEQVGELDEEFGIGLFEDDDYAMRVRAAGYEVACAEDVFVHHHASASIGALASAAYDELFNRNRVYFESKWGPWTPPVFRQEVQDVLARKAARITGSTLLARGVAAPEIR
jgi:GT2 family glycosyltransferase/glycosyltransferase involved in cell wall biosynthesis